MLKIPIFRPIGSKNAPKTELMKTMFARCYGVCSDMSHGDSCRVACVTLQPQSADIRNITVIGEGRDAHDMC